MTTTFTLTALALVGVGAARALAGRATPRRRRVAAGHAPEDGGRDARACRVPARRRRARLKAREGRRSVCR